MESTKRSSSWRTCTSPRDAASDPASLRADVPELVLDYLAAGVDIDHTTVFAQSSVPETSEIAWLLSGLVHLRDLERAPDFQRGQQRSENEPVNVALLNYPLLMAADILGPRAAHVAVGEDQYPHLELVRDIARRFTRRFFAGAEPLFPEPAAVAGDPVRVPGLDGSGKMGKSAGNTLAIADPADVRWAKLSVANTDPGRRNDTDPGTPERCPVFAIHQLVTGGARVGDIAEQCRGATLSCNDCKRALHTSITTLVEPIQSRRAELSAKLGLVREILHAGGVRARGIIAETRDVLQDKLGIVRY